MTVAIETLQEKAKSGDVVLLTVKREDGSTEQVQGKIEVASTAGVGFKPRGRREMDLLELDDVLELEEAPVPDVKLKQVKMKPVDATRVKKHLIDRHGAPLSQVNAMSPDQAAELHGKIDHSDLGHNHLKEDAEPVGEAAGEAPQPGADEDGFGGDAPEPAEY